MAAGIATVGYVALRRDAQNLRDTNRDNLLWSATQMEAEPALRAEGGDDGGAGDAGGAGRDAGERFDIL